jgi:hypothetical protein
MSDTMHWGPWEMSGDPVLAESLPTDQKEIGIQGLPIDRKFLKKLKELTDEERLKKADYMREYARKRKEKQEQDALDKQVKLAELRKIASTMTPDELINNVFSFV